MQVRVYVDGFNLYYGAVKGTSYKWLNPVELARQLVPAGYVVDKPIRMVTTERGKPVARQQAFLAALHTVEVHMGRYCPGRWAMAAKLRTVASHVTRSNVEGGTVSPSYSRNHNLEASRVVTNRWVQMSRDVTVIPPPTPGNLVDLPWSAPLTSAAPTVVGLDDARRSGYCSRGDQRSSRPCCLIGRRRDRHIRGWCFVLPSVCCVALQTERADPLYFLTD